MGQYLKHILLTLHSSTQTRKDIHTYTHIFTFLCTKVERYTNQIAQPKSMTQDGKGKIYKY